MTTRHPRTKYLAPCTLSCALLAAALLFGGCSTDTRSGSPGMDPRDRVNHVVYPALAGTVSESALLGSAQPVRVEGFGIVANLPQTGSGDMPPNVRSVLIDQLYKNGAGFAREGTQDIHPEEILQSKEIAVVEVHGYIPQMARRGSHFDLIISALSGTQTTSLEGGLLWPVELKVIGLAGADMESKTLADGRGPVYCTPAIAALNPAPSSDPAAPKRNTRRATILGGGQVAEDMPVTLQLYNPSFRTTGLIMRLVNSHFPSHDPLASAQNESLVQLKIPTEYQDDPQEFIRLLMHMYLSMDAPGFIDERAPRLIAALRDPAAPRDDISYALQGLGRTIIDPYLRPNYTSPDPVVRFYTARAGAALDDVSAMTILEQVADDAKSPLRVEAIEAIATIASRSETDHSLVLLGNLINDPDNNVRMAAYQGLRRIHTPLNPIRAFTTSRFDLDIVPSTGPSLIYVTQSGRARIALIGGHMEVSAGVLYVSPDSLFTLNVADKTAAASPASPVINADDAAAPVAPSAEAKPDESVLLYYRGPMGDQSISLKSSSNLGVLLAKLAYLPDPHAPNFNPHQQFIGLPYQHIVEMLSTLCTTGGLNATLIVQPAPKSQASLMDLAEEARPETSTRALKPSEPAPKP